MIIIMLGAQGTGKGTVAGILNKQNGWIQLSTGDIFRENIAKGTELGIEANKYISNGNLVPDEITISMVEKRLEELKDEKGIILDGFPRTTPQAEALEKLTKEINRPIDVVINLDCDENELVRRISGRRVCKNCGAPYHMDSAKPKVEGVCDICGGPLYQRNDDNEEALKVRLNHYTNQTKPLIDFYQARGLLANFDSLKGSEALFDEIAKFLKS